MGASWLSVKMVFMFFFSVARFPLRLFSSSSVLSSLASVLFSLSSVLFSLVSVPFSLVSVLFSSGASSDHW